MRSLLIALAIGSIFTACNSGKKTDVSLTGSDASMLNEQKVTSDGSHSGAPLQGNKRVVVVETRNANGTTTTTTTTESNVNKDSVAAVPVAKSEKPVIASTEKTQTVKKKGWSNRAKGALIGGVGGAAVGAVVSKKKVQGGVIGGLIGAGGGYIIGNEVEKKHN